MGKSISSVKRPSFVTVIVIVNIFGWITTEGIWVYFHLTGQIPPIEAANSYWEMAYIWLINGFTTADAIWSNLSLLFSIIGLWRMKAWGWLAAIMANTIWLYPMTFSLVRDFYIGLTPGTAFFLVFAIFAGISTVYLWKNRNLFLNTQMV